MNDVIMAEAARLGFNRSDSYAIAQAFAQSGRAKGTLSAALSQKVPLQLQTPSTTPAPPPTLQ
ncbi:hypothetical protein [Sphingomonas changbaiensis]|nr:hypothetical protein [Sphingomonas changbaiensis]